MKIAIVLLFVLGILFSSCSTIPDIKKDDLNGSENLLLNSSFELGEFDRDIMPLGWYTAIDEPGTVLWDRFNARTGEKSLRIKPLMNSIEIISESFPISPKNIYFINCYAKSLKPKYAAVKFAFMAFDKKGKKVNYYSDLFYPDKDWTEFGFRTDFLSDRARYARVIIILPEKVNTEFWLDDIESFIVHKFKK